VWLFESNETRFEGFIAGFDEYMNLVIDDCVEINTKKNISNLIGRIMLKGDNISLIRPIEKNE
jgi:small nuclear ribonucleoprotein E